MELLVEEVGESSSPLPRGFGAISPRGIKNDIYNRLLESENEEALSNPEFRRQLDAHFDRLPPSYLFDLNVDKAEDVVLHLKLLAKAMDGSKCPVFHCRLIQTKAIGNDDVRPTKVSSASWGRDLTGRGKPSDIRKRNCEIDFEPCSKLEDLSLDVKRLVDEFEDGGNLTEASSTRQMQIPVHEIIFSTADKPKLLSQLSALLSDVGLNIREAHVFSTLDGYSLDVFVVDGWEVEETEELDRALEEAIARSERSFVGPSHSVSEVPTFQEGDGAWEIDRRLLKIGEKIASGYCGDLYRGIYMGEDVAVKLLKSEHLNESSKVEFNQEISILREVNHRNVVRFIGACTKPAHLCIVTEYMCGGNLYDFLHEQNNVLELPLVLKFAIDTSKGMDYLHQKNIIHRDLKSANLLLDGNNVVKVADFGVARFKNKGGIMTAETGTYRWMAPEVINHQSYDHKADVYSFGIVLWELVTSKIPYENSTPVQAALGVRKGVRPDIPQDIHPGVRSLIQRCWDGSPSRRPCFSDITSYLEEVLAQVQSERAAKAMRK
ncbi:serine/threonine-protein kinase STY46-like isoform X2 [Wolffia australiana]